MANINMFALGGQDENGKNIFVIEVEEDIFVINAGLKYPINDKWGVDGIIADTEYLWKNKDRIKGIFLTHAHDEFFAALPWLLMDIEGLTIYGTKFTIDVAQKRVAKYRIQHSKYRFEAIKEKRFGKTNVRTFSAATSIPGALIYLFETPDGNILFMSETIIDNIGIFGNTNLLEVKAAANNKLLALVSDTRRANYPKPASENKSLKEYAEPIFAKTSQSKRIIFGAFDEEMYNILEIIDLANKYNRPVAFYGSAFDALYSSFQNNFNNYVKPKTLINYKNVNQIPNVVVLVTGTWSRLNDRFNRIAYGKDVYLRFKSDDAVIMYTPPVNGMEVEYSVMLDNITMITPNITSIDDKMVFPLRQSKDDIGVIVKTLQPKYFFPISSLYRYQKEATKMAIKQGVRHDRSIILSNGAIAYFKNGLLASTKGRIKPCGDVIIQGYGVGDISVEVIRERQKLSAGGLVIIATQYNRNLKQLVGDMHINIIGVVVKSEIKAYSDEIKNVVIQKFEQFEKFDYHEIQNAIRKRVQKIFSKKIGKEPLVVITFYDVE